MKKGEKKKQAKALAKRTERKSAKKAQQMAAAEGELRPIQQARKYPWRAVGCRAGGKKRGWRWWWSARRQPNGLLVFGNYLVDYYCLGVKSCLCPCGCHAFGILRAAAAISFLGKHPRRLRWRLAHELIYGGLEYAAGYGFRPDPDFKLAQLVLDPPEAHPRTGAVTFGKDGKPFYVSGRTIMWTAIMNTLMRTAGPGNFDYLAHIDNPPDELLSAAFDDADDVAEEDSAAT